MAIKVCKLVENGSHSHEDIDMDLMVMGFLEEAKLLDSLKGCPHVIQSQRWWPELQRKEVVIVMELCPLDHLGSLVKAQGRLAEAHAVSIMKQILTAVTHLQRAGVVHRDLKPANILVHAMNSEGFAEIKLCDFGAAVVLADGEPHGFTFFGTHPYKAPEVVKRQPHSFPADMWAVGVITHVLLTGEVPFGAAAKDTDQEAALLGSYAPPQGVSQDALDYLTALLQDLPENRLTVQEALRHPFLTCADVV